MSKLFPQSNILTIDLPESSETFSETYGRSDDTVGFIEMRNERLQSCKNVVQKAMDSVSLINNNEKYDLIWIDGAHGYPVIAMDIANSYRLSNTGAYVVVDDVWTKRARSDNMYDSVGAFESLEALKQSGLIKEYHLVHKRLGAAFNLPHEQKYIAVYVKS